MRVELESIEMPYHLCPVCGLQSQTTSRVCSEHSQRAYVIDRNLFLEQLVRSGLDDITHGRVQNYNRLID